MDLRAIAQALGGEVKGGQVMFPPPGHSAADRSGSLRLASGAPDGFLIETFAGDDPLRTKDWVRERLGMDRFAASPRSPSHQGGQRRIGAARPVAIRPQPMLSGVPIPAMTPQAAGDRWGLQAIGRAEPPPVTGELPGRRHAYRRDGTAVRFKIKKDKGAAFIDFYLVRDSASGATGWQAKKPAGYVPVPYTGSINPFDAELGSDTVFWPEGEKDVDTLDRLGLPAFTFGGTKDIPEGCAELLRGRDVVVLADNDEAGRDCAERKASCCLGIAARVRTIHFPELDKGQDVSDWVEGGGQLEELWRRVEAIGSESGPGADALLLGFAFDGDAVPEPPRFLVKGLLPAEGVAILGGQSGAGKTFTGIDLAVSLATGEPFFGRRIMERVGTLILAAEGVGTLPTRISAARSNRTDAARLPIAWLGAVPNLADIEEVKGLLPKIRAVDARMREQFGVRLGVIEIDTLAAAFALSDENDAAEAQQTLRHMRMLGEPIGALVLPIHHYGKSEDTGLRGSSAYRGGADAVLSVLADRNNATGEVGARSLNLAKTRYGEEGPIAGFTLRFVPIGIDEDGDPFGACIVDPTLDGPPPLTRKREKKDALPIVALKGAFDEAMLSYGREVRVRGDGPMVRAITVEEMRPEFKSRYATAETDSERAADTIRQAFKRALAACPKHGFETATWGGQEWLWRTP